MKPTNLQKVRSMGSVRIQEYGEAHGAGSSRHSLIHAAFDTRAGQLS